MKRLLIPLIVLILHSCSRNQTPYAQTRLIIKEISESKNNEIPESIKPHSSQHGEDLKNNIHLLKGLIKKHGKPATKQFQIERTKALDLGSKMDSITFVVVHISFGLQKEAPIPNTIVDFTYLEKEGNLLLEKIEVFGSKGKPQSGSPLKRLPNIKYTNLMELTIRLESGYKNRPFQSFDYTKDDLSERRDAQVQRFFDLINNADLDSSFNSSDIPRTIGSPEIVAVSFKLRDSDKQWMVYSIITEEPGYLEPDHEWIFIRRHNRYVNYAETYLIKKKSHQELDKVIKQLIQKYPSLKM